MRRKQPPLNHFRGQHHSRIGDSRDPPLFGANLISLGRPQLPVQTSIMTFQPVAHKAGILGPCPPLLLILHPSRSQVEPLQHLLTESFVNAIKVSSATQNPINIIATTSKALPSSLIARGTVTSSSLNHFPVFSRSFKKGCCFHCGDHDHSNIRK